MIRVILSKVGLDTHEVAIRVLSTSLRDAGMEVIYLGLGQMPERVAEVALQEGADVVGLSFLSGTHMTHTRAVLDEMKKRGLGDVLVIVGGTIPPQDIPAMRAMGVAEVFVAGSTTGSIIDFIRRNVGAPSAEVSR